MQVKEDVLKKINEIDEKIFLINEKISDINSYQEIVKARTQDLEEKLKENKSFFSKGKLFFWGSLFLVVPDITFKSFCLGFILAEPINAFLKRKIHEKEINDAKARHMILTETLNETETEKFSLSEKRCSLMGKREEIIRS